MTSDKPPHEDRPPAFMDIQALAARARAPERSEEEGQRNDAPAVDAAPVKPRTGTVAEPDTNTRVRNAVGIGFALLAILAIAALVLPWFARAYVVRRAREAGVELSIREVHVSFRGLALEDVRAHAAGAPGLVATAREVRLFGATGHEVVITGAESTADLGEGSSENLRALYTNVLRMLAGSEDAARRVTVAGAAMTLRAPGDTTVRAKDVDVTLEVKPRGHDVRASVRRVEVETAGVALGPWAGTLEDHVGRTTARLIFDPPVPDGPHALVVWTSAEAPTIAVEIRRTRLANLGLQGLELPALPGTEIAASIDARPSAPGRVSAKGKIELFGAKLGAFAQPVDVVVAGEANGASSGPLTLEKTTATVGPFSVNVAGTMGVNGGAFTVDASFKTRPIPCSDIARAEAKKLGVLAALVQEAAERSGAARVTGTALAQGTVTFDSRTPKAATISMTTRDSCGLSLFGP